MDKTEETGENTTVPDAGVQQHDADVTTGETSRDEKDAKDFSSLRSIVKEVKGENAVFKTENSSLRNEVGLLRQEMNQIRQERQKVAEKDPYEGRDETDYLTIGEERERNRKYDEKLAQKEQQLVAMTEAIAFESSNPDYKEIINKYGKLLPLSTREFMARYPNDPKVMKVAYDTCKGSAEYYKDTLKSSQHENSKRAAENMSKPGAGSSAGSGGTVSLVNKLKNMSKEERIAYSNKCIDG